jgi:dimethylargininase
MLTAITREVSPAISQCELSFHVREPIDVSKAIEQHRAYELCLQQLGVTIVSLPPEPDLPDSVFVEDAAVVLDQVAVIPIMGAPSRRAEIETLIPVLTTHHRIERLQAPALLDGGDVVRAGHRIFVGLSQRTNREAIDQLREIGRPLGYQVEPIELTSILHLKSACSYLGDNTMLINRRFVDPAAFNGFKLIDVAEQEPAAANVLAINGSIIMPDCFPQTAALLRNAGFRIRTIDVSELQKAEAGVTCCSIIFESAA